MKHLDEILRDLNQENRNDGTKEVNRMVDLLNQLKTELDNSIDVIFKPKFKVTKDPIDVLLIEGLLPSEKVIMVILHNREDATTEQMIVLTGMQKGGVNRALRNLKERGLIVKIKNGLYKINNKSIF